MIALAVLLCVAAAARAQQFQPWNGREATTLALRLSEQVGAALDAASRSMPQGSNPQRKERDAAVDRMTELQAAVEQLLPKLVQLQGPDQTKAPFELVQERVDAARKYMREGKPTAKLRAYWSDANATFVKLARYYGVDGREPEA